MLFLQLPADPAAKDSAESLPIDDAAAFALERALLAGDEAKQLHELVEAVAEHCNLASWALRLAETRTGQTVNHPAQAAVWLGNNLAGELAVALTSDSCDSTPYNIGWRLPLVVAKLASSENRLRDFDRRLEREKLESLKELAYGASHEINNPLANIAARAQTLLEDETDPERQRKLIAIHRQAMRAHEMISDLMLFARPPKLNRTNFDLQKLVEQVVGELQDLANEKSAQLRSDAKEPITLSADPTQLGVAISAVVKNALEAVREGGLVHVSTRCESDAAIISVSDDGPGISPEVLREHLFDPFYSGREAGRGLGFGLSKSWRIVTDHGGEIGVTPRVVGAEFVIRLPILSESRHSL